jgi:hypothetical protein
MSPGPVHCGVASGRANPALVSSIFRLEVYDFIPP